MTERPKDPAAERPRGPVLAENAADHLPGPASAGCVKGRSAHPDVAAFIAARAAAMATRAADDSAAPLDPAPHPAPPDPAPPDPECADPELPDAEPPDPALPLQPEVRPRIVEDPAILGLSRVSRSRLGSRLFTWFFVFIYVLIIVQLIVSLLQT